MRCDGDAAMNGQLCLNMRRKQTPAKRVFYFGCSVVSYSASVSPIVAACPAAGQWPTLPTGGVTLPTFPPQSPLTFVVDCGVTATGQ